MYTITVSEKGGQQSTYDFNQAEITIGRMKGNDIVLPKGNVSKRHSRISSHDGTFRVVDLGSTNGTYVNGRKITGEQTISDADKIYIGDFILQVESEAGIYGGAPALPPPAPPFPAPTPPPAMPGLDSPADDPFAASSGESFGSDDFNFGSSASGSFDPPPAAPPVAPPPSFTPGNGSLLGTTPNYDLGFMHQVDDGAAPTPVPTPAAAPPPPAPVAPPVVVASAPPLQVPPAEPVAERPRAERFGRSVSHVGAVLASNELASEFDPVSQAARHDVASVLFEKISVQDLPLAYPPSQADADRFRVAVANAVQTVNPNVDHDALIDQMTRECVGLGPVDTYLDAPDVREIYVNRADFVLVRRDAGFVRAALTFSHPQLLAAAAYRLLGPRENEVLTDELRFADGTRVHVALPPIAPEGAVISVRKPPASHPTLDELVEAGALTGGMAEFLLRATQGGRSMLIAGPSGSGKSTLLSAITQQIASGVRVVGVDSGGHLKLGENSIRLEPHPPAFDARRLLHSALAMHPQRIVLDECRGVEAYDWVTAAAAGTEGSLATIHGTSAAEALGKLESLSLLTTANIAPRGLREQVARAVNLVIVVNRNHDGKFRVHQITEVQGVDLDAFRLNDVFYYRVEGTEGRFHPTGYVPQFFEDMRHAGVDVDFGIFRE